MNVNHEAYVRESKAIASENNIQWAITLNPDGIAPSGLGWLMVPQEQCVFTYTPGSEPEVQDGDFVAGEKPVEDFFLFLDDVWRLDVYKRFY